MKVLQFLLYFSVFCAARVAALNCYVCDGDKCNQINSVMSEYCGPSTTTTEASTSTGSTADTSTISSTIAPIEPSTGSSTSSDSTTVATTVTTSTDPSTSSESTTVAATVTTTEPPTETTVLETVNTAENLLRRRRSISTEDISPTDLLLQNYRLRSRSTRAGLHYMCYSITVPVPNGDGTKRKHGCIAVTDEQTACGVLREDNKIPPNMDDKCQYCSTDDCNSSTTLRLSILAIASALIASYLHL